MDRRAGNGKSAVETDFVKFVTKFGSEKGRRAFASPPARPRSPKLYRPRYRPTSRAGFQGAAGRGGRVSAATGQMAANQAQVVGGPAGEFGEHPLQWSEMGQEHLRQLANDAAADRAADRAEYGHD